MQLHGYGRVMVYTFTSSPSSSKTSASKKCLETHPTLLRHALILVHHTYMRMKHHHSSVILHSCRDTHTHTHTHTLTHICASLKCYAALQDPLLNQRGRSPAPAPHLVTITLHRHHPVGQSTSFWLSSPFSTAPHSTIYICLTFPVALLFSILYDSI